MMFGLQGHHSLQEGSSGISLALSLPFVGTRLSSFPNSAALSRGQTCALDFRPARVPSSALPLCSDLLAPERWPSEHLIVLDANTNDAFGTLTEAWLWLFLLYGHSKPYFLLESVKKASSKRDRTR